MSKKKFGITAIIYDKRGNILSIGKNSYVKTHPLQAMFAKKVDEEHKSFLHAEVDAIIKLRKIKGAKRISVFRFMEDGTPAMAHPCKICMQAIKYANIEIIEHT
ncbi:MAG: Cytidine and deoxycytidylate deaminase zinc-binding region [Parcubacteria group bacterium ADurb.Bin216]|nr:MAG: Cytidine and deoxycytidylate deaminase zinc-binding region [Parcubacteria group bacterium ADurb.Bin216]